jgi:hypothetical protein
MPRAIVALSASILIATVAMAWVFRYSTTVGPTGLLYRTDHWTGQTVVCWASQCYTIAN